MTESFPPALAIMGSTGTGKTDLAVELVSRFPFEIISVDSAMVYQEMNIGTAKPDANVLAKAPHRLIDVISPEQVYSAARFCQEALGAMQAITKSGKIPLLVGGTGLYFRSLLEGISELPSADPDIRKRIEQEAKKSGWQTMHDRLKLVDPAAARRIHPNDPQRIERALEVYEITGKPISSLFEEDTENYLPFKMINIILEPADRAWLHTRLAVRFAMMLEQGLIDEVHSLRQKYNLSAELPSMRLVGYRQVWQYLAGEINAQTMQEKAVIATRQLAKRQMTWFRADQSAHRVRADVSSPLNQILQIVNKGQLFLS